MVYLVNYSHPIQPIPLWQWLRLIFGVAMLVAVAIHISLTERWDDSEFDVAYQFGASAGLAIVASFVTQKFLSWPVAMLATATIAGMASAYFTAAKFHPVWYLLDGIFIGIAVFIVLGKFERREYTRSQIPDHEEA